MKSRTSAPPPPSRGIRGAVKNRLVKDMFDVVPGGFKVLIVDNAAAVILNAAMRMHELMDHGVTLVEMISNARQPLPTSPALYFVSPIASNVEAIIRDWATKSMYSEAHVFFTSTAPNELVQQFSGSRAANNIKNMKDLLLDFNAPESQLFSFEMRYDLQSFFGSNAALRRSKLDQAAANLVSIMLTLGEPEPVIRYQDTDSARAVATSVQSMIGIVAKGMTGASFAVGGEAPATLLICDRSVDLAECLLHELFYQAFLSDVMPLENGIYKQTYKDRAGKDAVRAATLDEEDPVWFRYRHSPMMTLLKGLADEMNRLLAENPDLAGGMNKGAKLAELGEAVRQLPKFQEQQSKLSLHMDIAEKLSNIFQRSDLVNACELEQKIAAGETSDGVKVDFKTLFKEVLTACKSPMNRDNKIRLILLMAVSTGTSLTKDKAGELIQAARLGAEEVRLIDALVQKFNATATRERRPKAVGVAKTSDNSLSHYEPRLKYIVECALKETLPEKEFPATKPVKSVVSPAAVAGKSLRSGITPKFSSTIAGSRGGNEKVLDLGQGKKVSLSTTKRVVVCVLGGITYGESRCLYELIESEHREIVFGGTSIMTPMRFVSELGMLE